VISLAARVTRSAVLATRETSPPAQRAMYGKEYSEDEKPAALQTR